MQNVQDVVPEARIPLIMLAHFVCHQEKMHA